MTLRTRLNLLAKSLRLLLVTLGLQAGVAGVAMADEASTYFYRDTRVSVSTITASPTTLVTKDTQARDIWLINNNTDYVLLGDADTSFSTSATTGCFRLPGTVASTNPIPFVIHRFIGTLKGVAGGSGPINVDVLGAK